MIFSDQGERGMRDLSIRLALLALACGCLQAQLVDCNVSLTGYKILLDDVVYSGPATGSVEQKLFMNRLRVKLLNDLERLKVQTQLPFTVVRCEGRRPNDAGDFRTALVDALNSRNVLLELWGNIVAGDGSGADTTIGFALIPMRFYERNSQELPGIYQARYTTRAATSSKLLEMIGASGELRAFALVAGGSKALRERRYNEAYASLCVAAKQAEQLKADGLQSYREPLSRYALRLAGDAVKKANQDPAYSGALALVNPSAVCGGGAQ
jgi:hypothetical protein